MGQGKKGEEGRESPRKKKARDEKQLDRVEGNKKAEGRWNGQAVKSGKKRNYKRTKKKNSSC